jgi:hypothetical protein
MTIRLEVDGRRNFGSIPVNPTELYALCHLGIFIICAVEPVPQNAGKKRETLPKF